MNFEGLVSADEMIQSAAVICNSLRAIPCVGDGDTGYGNAMNVKRTIAKYSQAGMAGIMIEDQVKQTCFRLCISTAESTF
jgi:2-methylisocitrate lyase-like PEP mutase family enzyme